MWFYLLQQQPFIIRDDESPKGFKGYCIDLIEEIRQIVKFDYEITLAPDNNFGVMDENGNWNGVVKELIEKRADIGASLLFYLNSSYPKSTSRSTRVNPSTDVCGPRGYSVFLE